MKQQVDNFTFLTHAPVHKVILKMAVPTIISMLVTSFYNMADTYFVGQINTQSTAAVGIVYSVMTIVQAVGFFFGHGSGNYISRKLGAREVADAERMAATGFFYAIVAGIVIAALGLAFLTPLSHLLGSTPTILPYTERYLGIILLGTPFMTGGMVMNNQMRFQGNAALAMYGIVSGAVLNVVLDPLFIFGFGMGISGAATATVLSQMFSFCILFRMTHNRQNIGIRPRNFSLAPHYMKEIFLGGTPSLSRQGLGSLSTAMLNVAASAYGDAAIAGMSIVTRITMFLYATVIGLCQGFQPLCGFCYGARLYSRVHEGFSYSIKLGTAFLTVCAVVGFLFSGHIVELFRDDPAVIVVGSAAFRWQLLTYPFITYIVATNMLLQTIRKPIRANLVAAARSGLFFIPLIIILPRCFGLLGVEICQAAADACALALSVPMAISAFNDMKHRR
ncbi:MAG: MATE family efflux transporter [Bacteroidales bacterium]|nr:MATE family efflux transporter [Bacteroidales bacterium]